MPKEKWQIVYDIGSAGHAEMIRTFFEMTGVKYINVKVERPETDDVNVVRQEEVMGTADAGVEIQAQDKERYLGITEEHVNPIKESSGVNKNVSIKGSRKRKAVSGPKKGSKKRKCSLSAKDELRKNVTGASASRDNAKISGTRLSYPALPIIRKGGVEMSHVAVILRYLGEQYGLCPEAEVDRLLADQIVQYSLQYWDEGKPLFVAVGNCLTEADPPLEQGRLHCRERFLTQRMPMWSSFFAQCLRRTMEGKKYLFGKCMSYADVALHHIMSVTGNVYPSKCGSRGSTDMRLLQDYRLRISSLGCVRAYIRSRRYCSAGYFFHTNYLP